MSRTTPFELDFNELVSSLPQPVLLSKADLAEKARTYFICILGFEPRCHTTACMLADRGWHADAAICIHYEQRNMQDTNQVYKDQLYAALHQITGGQEPLSVNEQEHDLGSDFGQTLLNTITEANQDVLSPEVHIVFDISVGSSRLLLEALHSILSSAVHLTVIYAEAHDYRPEFSEYLSFLEESRHEQIPAPEFLTVGVAQVGILRGIPGNDADDRPTCLIGFPSFSPIRFLAVLEEISPSRVEWVFGVPHLVQNRWRLDAQKDYHATLIEPSHRHCYVSTFDYQETLTLLESIYRRNRRDYALLVCSLGSKLQKLGQSLFHILRPEVGAVAVTPRVWDPERYSSMTAQAVYAIPFGNCGELRSRLWRTRTLRI